MLYDSALEQVLLNDFGDILNLNLAVKASLGVNNHNRAECAKAETACFYNLDLFAEAFCFDLFFESLDNSRTVRGCAAGTAANENMGTIHICFPPYLSSDATV